jgi:hypothetical protein
MASAPTAALPVAAAKTHDQRHRVKATGLRLHVPCPTQVGRDEKNRPGSSGQQEWAGAGANSQCRHAVEAGNSKSSVDATLDHPVLRRTIRRETRHRAEDLNRSAGIDRGFRPGTADEQDQSDDGRPSEISFLGKSRAAELAASG